MSFKDYKKNSAVAFQKALEEAERINAPSVNFEKDPDDWYPSRDKGGNGLAVIRFLPAIESEGLTTVKWLSHSFSNIVGGEKRWYIENSLKTFGEDKADPVAEYNRKLWNSADDDDDPARKQAKNQARKTNYRCNIFVLSDSANPENNGKIKKFKFAKTLYEYVRLAMFPPVIEGIDVQEEPLKVFDLFEGANFEIRIYTEKKGKESYPNYSKSKWGTPGPLANEATMEQIYNEIQTDPKWSISQYIADEKFKSYEDLKKRLDFVMGFDTAGGKSVSDKNNEVFKMHKPKEERESDKENMNRRRRAEVKETPSQEPDDEFMKNLIEDDRPNPFLIRRKYK